MTVSMTLVEPSIHDFDMSKKSWRILILSMWSSSLICGLIMLPREIRVVPPPWIICLRIWSTGLLSKIVESDQLFHLRKYCHRWTTMCLVHRTSTNRTTINWKCVCSIDGLSYTQSIQSLDNCIHPLGQL
jgi:hypothetical protein